jgi:hypothetical protein
MMNVFKYTPLCHANCDEDCDLLPNETHMNCISCLPGLTLHAANQACEIACAANEYPKNDYTTCQPCPPACLDCGFDTTNGVTYPFVP